MPVRTDSFQSSLRALLFVLMSLVATLTSCISLEDEVEEVSPLSALRADSAIVEETFSMLYIAPKGIKDFSPIAVYTTNFWTPTFFEYAQPNIKSIPMEKFNDTIWVANVQVPRNAQLMSYTVLGVPNEDSLATKNFPILDSRTKRPVKATMYRIAQSLIRSNAPTDSVLKMLRAEIERYPDTYDAYILYWSIYYNEKGRTEEALAEIESQMAELRRQRRNNADLLQAIALTYIYGIGDKIKANRVLQDSPDSYLHPLNLYNRFNTEIDIDKRELALSVMADKYQTHPLTPKMYREMLYYYIANQKVYADRAAIFAEKVWRRNLNSLRQNGVMTAAVRYLFEYYSKIDLSRAMPYVKELLRLDYDKQVYDVHTILLFAERFAESQEYSGLAIELAAKAIQVLESKEKSAFFNPNAEREFVASAIESGEAKNDLLGRAYYCIGKAYRRVNETSNAISNLRQAANLSLSRRAEIYYELASAMMNIDKSDAQDYAYLALAFNPTPERREWFQKNFKPRLRPKETLQDKIEQFRNERPERASSVTLTLIDGSKTTINTQSEKVYVFYFWSPTSTMSKLLFSDLQLLHAKYRARGVDLYAIDTDSALSTVKAAPSEFGYSFPFATVDPLVLSQYRIAFLPSAIVVKDGAIVARHSGYERDFVARLEADVQQFFTLGEITPKKKSRR
ncbi:MAG: TlpA disulfide reductase family protein [Chloroherpetonaceae bacterium]